MSFSDFLATISNKPLAIVPHKGADIDALCSSAALFYSLQDLCEPNIVIPEHINLEAKKLAEYFKIPYTVNTSLEDFYAYIFVDLNSLSMLGKLAKQIDLKKPSFLIDHHKMQKPFIKKEFLFCDENASASAVLVYKLIKENALIFNAKIAQLLSLAIIADTAKFSVSNAETFSIMAELLNSTNLRYEELLSLLKFEPHISERLAKLKALQRVKIEQLNDLLLALSHVNAFESDAAQCLISCGADISFVAGMHKKQLIISCRASSKALTKDIDLVEILNKIPFGSKGGHNAAAALNAENFSKDVEFALEKCAEATKQYLKEKNLL